MSFRTHPMPPPDQDPDDRSDIQRMSDAELRATRASLSATCAQYETNPFSTPEQTALCDRYVALREDLRAVCKELRWREATARYERAFFEAQR